MSKVEAMKMHLDVILAEPVVKEVLFVDVLSSGEEENEVTRVLETADAILDFSASVPVARKAGSGDTCTRPSRVGFYETHQVLLPSCFCEDPQRLSRLDSLEMQYYARY